MSVSARGGGAGGAGEDELLAAARALRTVLLCAAREPGPAPWARATHSDDVAAAQAAIDPLIARRLGPGRRRRTLARLWVAVAVRRWYYRLTDYDQVEREAWAVLDAASPGRISSGTLRRLVELRDDAAVLSRYGMRDDLDAVLQAAAAFNDQRRHGDADQALAAAIAAMTRAGRRSEVEDQSGWPVVDQVELLQRVEDDRVDIRVRAVFGGDAEAESAKRRLEPWLAELAQTLAGPPLSTAALEVAAEQWRGHRGPYFPHPRAVAHAQCRVTDDPAQVSPSVSRRRSGRRGPQRW